MSARRSVRTDSIPVVDQSFTFTMPNPSVLKWIAVQCSWYTLDPKIHTGPNPCVEAQQKHILLSFAKVVLREKKTADTCMSSCSPDDRWYNY